MNESTQDSSLENLLSSSTLSMFRDFYATDKPYYRSVQFALDRIKNGDSRQKVEQLRVETNENKRDAIKKSLPCVCFSGKFLKRNDNSMVSHSGFMILDFDKLIEKGKDLRGFIKEVSKHSFVVAAFVSPSGNGVKVLVRVHDNGNMHRGQFAALKQVFPDADPSGVNESRICFESYDPEIYINADATRFEGFVAAPKVEVKQGTKSTTYNYSKLDAAVKKIRNAQDGERHNELLKAARLAGGYIESGFLPEHIAIQILETEFSSRPYNQTYNPLKTIQDGIEYGKRVPIYEQQNDEVQPQKEKNSSGVIFLSDVWSKMLEQRRTGKPRGTTTYFPEMDKHWTWKKGEITLWSGRPGSGKSEFLLQLMLIKSVKQGTKWACFCPENDPADEFYDNLIHSHSGMSTDPFYKNLIPEVEYELSAQFIHEHFFLVSPDAAWTPKEIESSFEYCIKELGCQGTMIDPFNKMQHDMKGLRDDHYVSEFMNVQKRFARRFDIYNQIVLHPHGLRKNSQGGYDVVGPYELANGAMWINKTDNFVVVHRPNQDTDPSDSTVEIHVKKIKKQKLVGVPGMFMLNFDRRQNRYFDFDYSPLKVNEVGKEHPTQETQVELNPPF